MSSTSNTVSVTNNSTSTVVTLDAYDPNAKANAPQAEQVYQLPLTIRNTSSGGPTIEAGANASLTLDAARIIYDFIFARPADLFPIMNTSLMQNIISGQYPPLTIDAASQAQLNLALTFYINLLVYPTSNTAQKYYAAVSGTANNGNSASDINDAVTAFFQSTTNYKTLDLNSVVTAQTYTTSFAYIWAGFSQNFASFNSSITYYLYSTGTAQSGTNTAPPTAQGTLTLTKNASPPNPADPTDRTGAYTITYTSPSGATTTMFYSSGGQFVSANSDFPAVALRGTFVLKSTLTNNASDNVIIPIITGSVNGVRVIGTTRQQSTTGGDKSDFWAFFHPTTFGQWMTLITSFIGLAMGLEWIGSKAKSAYDWFTDAPKPPTAADIQAMRNDINALGDQVRQAQQQNLDQLGNREVQVPAENQMPAAQANGQADAVEANNVARADAQLDVLEQQAAQVEVVAEFGVNPQVEQLAENIRNGAEKLQAGMQQGGEQLQQAVDNVGGDIVDNIQPNLNQAIENVQQQIGQEQQAELERAQEAQAEAQKVAEQAQEKAQDAGEGEGGEGEDPIEGGIDA